MEPLLLQLTYVPRVNRFTDLLEDPLSILPQPAPEDSDLDHSSHTAIIYTMATCHSLRIVDEELIGDPLDVKMFQFTQWAYDEGIHTVAEVAEEADFTSPSIARSPYPVPHEGNEMNGTVCHFQYCLFLFYPFLFTNVNRPPLFN